MTPRRAGRRRAVVGVAVAVHEGLQAPCHRRRSQLVPGPVPGRGRRGAVGPEPEHGPVWCWGVVRPLGDPHPVLQPGTPGSGAPPAEPVKTSEPSGRAATAASTSRCGSGPGRWPGDSRAAARPDGRGDRDHHRDGPGRAPGGSGRSRGCDRRPDRQDQPDRQQQGEPVVHQVGEHEPGRAETQARVRAAISGRRRAKHDQHPVRGEDDQLSQPPERGQGQRRQPLRAHHQPWHLEHPVADARPSWLPRASAGRRPASPARCRPPPPAARAGRRTAAARATPRSGTGSAAPAASASTTAGGPRGRAAAPDQQQRPRWRGRERGGGRRAADPPRSQPGRPTVTQDAGQDAHQKQCGEAVDLRDQGVAQKAGSSPSAVAPPACSGRGSPRSRSADTAVTQASSAKTADSRLARSATEPMGNEMGTNGGVENGVERVARRVRRAQHLSHVLELGGVERQGVAGAALTGSTVDHRQDQRRDPGQATARRRSGAPTTRPARAPRPSV